MRFRFKGLQRPKGGNSVNNVSHKCAIHVAVPKCFDNRFKWCIRAYCRRPRLHDILYYGSGVAIESSAPYASEDHVMVVNYYAHILACGLDSVDGIAKPVIQMAYDIVSAHRSSCVQ